MNNKAATLLGEKVTPLTWHNCLGHPQFKILKHTIEKFGLPTTQLPNSYICESCCISKAHKLPFSASSQTSNKPLELVHSDLWGPAPVTSHFSFQYYVIFIDDYKKLTRFYPLKRKSDVLDTFITFYHQVERKFSTKLILFQSDWGGEFQTVNQYLKTNAVIHRVSCQRTPFLKNRSPFEVLIKRLPDYKFMKTFGCLCYPNFRPYAQNELTLQSDQCVFLGYSALHHGYRCLSLNSGKMHISRNVVFNETTFHI